jgi:hypothetical protein
MWRCSCVSLISLPEIVRAILVGQQPVELTPTRLVMLSRNLLPHAAAPRAALTAPAIHCSPSPTATCVLSLRQARGENMCGQIALRRQLLGTVSMTNRTILLWVLAAFLIFAFILISPNPPAALIGRLTERN